MNDTAISARQWYVAKYPALGWMETFVKLIAIVLGIMALVTSITKGSAVWPSGLRLLEFAIMAFLAIGLFAAIFDRLIEREIVAMIFVLFNNLAHWGMAASLIYLPNDNPYLFPFCALMTLGDMVKTIFIKAHSFQVRNIPQIMLFGLTAAYIVGYLVILILQLLH
jgi:hypothetical protein